jgi:hypothetical protein
MIQSAYVKAGTVRMQIDESCACSWLVIGELLSPGTRCNGLSITGFTYVCAASA